MKLDTANITAEEMKMLKMIMMEEKMMNDQTKVSVMKVICAALKAKPKGMIINQNDKYTSLPAFSAHVAGIKLYNSESVFNYFYHLVLVYK